MTAKHWRLSVAIFLFAGISVFVFYRYQSIPPQRIPPDPVAVDLEPAVAVTIRTMRERVLQEPKSPKAWGELGQVFLANDLLDEARTCLIEASRLEQNNPSWPYLQAVTLARDGNRESALPHFRRAVELSPDDAKANLVAHLALVETQLYLGLTNESIALIHHVLDQAPDDPRVQFDAGLLAIALDDREAAFNHLIRCFTSPYARKKARIQMAAVCQRSRDFAKANELQKESDQLPPDWDWPDSIVEQYGRWAIKREKSYKMVESFELQGRFEEAVRIARSLVESYPDDDFALALLGRLLAQMGDFQGSERALQRAIQLAPHSTQPHYLLSLLLIQQGEILERKANQGQAEAMFREAVNQSRLALAIKPDYGFAHKALGQALQHLGKTAEALKELEEAVRCSPEFAEMHLQLAEVLVDLGRKDEACSRYETALRLASPGVSWRASAEARLTELRKLAKKPGN